MTSQAREDTGLDSLAARSAETVPGRIDSFGPHADQVIEWFACGASPLAPVVFVHGGYFRPTIDRSHARVTAEALAVALYRPVVLAEYRRVSGHPEATVADICAISDLLEGLGEGPAAWVGHSAGGTLVLQRAFDQVRPPVPTIALAPIADLRSGLSAGLGAGAIELWLGPRTAAKPSRYAHLDPSTLLTDVPERLSEVVCLHGQDDATVPASQSGESRIPHRILAGAHHFDLIDPASAVWADVVAAIREKAEAGAADR